MELLSAIDLWFLFSLHSPSVIIGLTNPVAGYLKKDIVAIKKEKERDLLIKGFLTKVGDEITISSELNHFIISIANARHTFLIIRSENGQKEITSLHFGEKDIVRLSTCNQETYELETVTDHPQYLDYILNTLPNKRKKLNLDVKYDTEFIKGIRVKKKQNSIADIHDQIETMGVSKDVQEPLINLFSNPAIGLSVVAFLDRNNTLKNIVKSYAILSDKKNTLLMEPVGKDALKTRLQFQDKQYIHNKIEALFKQAEI